MMRNSVKIKNKRKIKRNRNSSLFTKISGKREKIWRIEKIEINLKK